MFTVESYRKVTKRLLKWDHYCRNIAVTGFVIECVLHALTAGLQPAAQFDPSQRWIAYANKNRYKSLAN
jgi:hypothetical protein